MRSPRTSRITQLLAAAALASPAYAQGPEARQPLENVPLEALFHADVLPQGEAPSHRLVIKFVDAARVRAEAGELTSLGEHELAAVNAIASEHQLAFARLIDLPDEALLELEGRAALLSGKQQADLAGIVRVEIAAEHADDPSHLEDVGRALRVLPIVEYAYIETLFIPPPGDIAPTTPNLSGFQTYRLGNPGMDVNYAWSLDARGAGVRLSDCEYGWRATHEDLNDIDLHLEPGQIIEPALPADWREHGTAAIGVTSSVANSYGCSGTVIDADVYTFPEWTTVGPRRVACVASAISASAEGDVVQLEMQAVGPGGGFAPAEVDPSLFLVVQTGTNAGVLVVGASGNGLQDLDSAPYAAWMGWGDSGAILVGGGVPNIVHNHDLLSSYGSRVNLHGWGFGVFTLGYGTYATYGGDENQRYVDSFAGTSAATPFVSGAAVALQGKFKELTGGVLTPLEIREHLIATGIPQGAGPNVGPLPDMREALDALFGPEITNYCVSTPNSSGSAAVMSASGTADAAINDLVLSAGPGPVGQPGLFYYGPGEIQLSFGNGFRCVIGAQVQRLFPVSAFAANGIMSYTLDLAAAPTSAIIAPGSTWKFQAWFRDPLAGASGFDLSDGLSIRFAL
jgi:hypothetical protein